MHHARSNCLSILNRILVACASVVGADLAAGQNQLDVECVLDVDPGPYVSEEPIWCEVAIKNNTTGSVRVVDPAAVASGYEMLRISDANGRRVEYLGSVDDPDYIDGQRLSMQATIPPSSSLQRRINLNAAWRRFDVSRTGRYTIQGVCNLWVEGERRQILSAARHFDVLLPTAEFSRELRTALPRPGGRQFPCTWHVFTHSQGERSFVFCRLALGRRGRFGGSARIAEIRDPNSVQCVVTPAGSLHVLMQPEARPTEYEHLTMSLSPRGTELVSTHLGRYQATGTGQSPTLVIAENGNVSVLRAILLPEGPRTSTTPATKPTTTTAPATEPTTTTAPDAGENKGPGPG